MLNHRAGSLRLLVDYFLNGCSERSPWTTPLRQDLPVESSKISRDECSEPVREDRTSPKALKKQIDRMKDTILSVLALYESWGDEHQIAVGLSGDSELKRRRRHERSRISFSRNVDNLRLFLPLAATPLVPRPFALHVERLHRAVPMDDLFSLGVELSDGSHYRTRQERVTDLKVMGQACASKDTLICTC